MSNSASFLRYSETAVFGLFPGHHGRSGKHILWHVFDYGVERDAVVTYTGQRCVSFEFRLDVVVNVIAVDMPF